MEFRRLLRQLKRRERFFCTLAAINELLLEKKVYAMDEFEVHFCANARAKLNRKKNRRKK